MSERDYMTPHWNRCDYCGQFIGLAEFSDNSAQRHMVTPDTAFTAETYETWHLNCKVPQVASNAE